MNQNKKMMGNGNIIRRHSKKGLKKWMNRRKSKLKKRNS
jgi:hypothetical protein